MRSSTRSPHVGRVDDGALVRVMDHAVLDVKGVSRDDALDEVLFPEAVQREPAAAAVDLAPLGNESLEWMVDVVLAWESGVARSGKAAGGHAVHGAGAVEVDDRLEA